jgi:hypothetical protein
MCKGFEARDDLKIPNRKSQIRNQEDALTI